jgi:hypothetical protein
MSRRELAQLASEFLAHPIDEKYIGKLERGVYRWPSSAHRGAIRRALGDRSDRDLGFYVSRPPRAGRGVVEDSAPYHERGAALTDLAGPAASVWGDAADGPRVHSAAHETV